MIIMEADFFWCTLRQVFVLYLLCSYSVSHFRAAEQFKWPGHRLVLRRLIEFGHMIFQISTTFSISSVEIRSFRLHFCGDCSGKLYFPSKLSILTRYSQLFAKLEKVVFFFPHSSMMVTSSLLFLLVCLRAFFSPG